jgi:hypothetical protein
LNGRDELLHQALWSVARPRWRRLVEALGEVQIGMSVRLGNDFRAARSPQDYYEKGAIKTPLEWYVETLRQVREAADYPARAVVTSDGTRKELQPLLDLGHVLFLRPGCAISDLLVLSRARVLIGAGGSSFSAWAAFLGQMPTVSHPGQSLAWFRLANRRGHYVGEFDPARPEPAFLEQAAERLGAREGRA